MKIHKSVPLEIKESIIKDYEGSDQEPQTGDLIRVGLKFYTLVVDEEINISPEIKSKTTNKAI